MAKTVQFLSYLRNLGIKLYADGDELVCHAQSGVLTPALRQKIAEQKEEILQFLQQANLVSEVTPSLIERVDRDRDLPLSFSQQRLWFLAQLEENSTPYNEYSLVKIDGALQVSILEDCLSAIVERHEILRTTFPLVNGTPVQVIAPTSDITCRLIDLQDLSEIEQLSEVQRLATALAQKSFDLAKGPTMLVRLIRLSSHAHVLLLCIHHIVADGWSRGVFLKELSTLYQTFLTGNKNLLPELPIQYVDFACWQRKWLSGKVLKTQLNYWKQQLAGAPPLLKLPTDRMRPAVQTFQGAKFKFQINLELTQELLNLSQKSETTPFMTLLAILVTLLSRYSGQDDILIGSPIANRNYQQTESLIGCFVNTLVLRTQVKGNPSFCELLNQVRQVALDAYAHQDVPFEKVVEALQPERNLSYSPLFQVMFVWQSTPMEKFELPGLTLTPLEMENFSAKFDLTLAIDNTEQGIIGSWEYNSDLFDEGTIARMSQHFQRLLEAIVSNREQQVGKLPLLTEAEQYQLLLEWNSNYKEYACNQCIHQLFEAQVERTPDSVALRFAESVLTYRELNTRANQLARYLRRIGVKPEVLVGIFVERSVEMVVGILGILKAGGAYVPLDPAYPQERLAFILEDAQVPVLLLQQELVDRLPKHHAQVVCLNTDMEDISQESQDNLTSEIRPHNLAYVIYTSGSTGKPKGVAIEHYSTVHLLHWAEEIYTMEQLAGVLASTSICFDLSVFELFVPLSWGGEIILVENVLHLSTLPNKKNITLINTVPSAIAELLRVNDIPEGVRTVNLAGEPLQNSLVQELYQREKIEQVFNLYGPSEDTTYSIYSLVTKGYSKTPVIGRPITNTQVYILDCHLQAVPIGVPGEIYIGGAGLARGYYKRPELTAEKFIPNPFGDNRLYKTGDLARYLPNGNIEFLGRIDRQVKIRGFRIELGEIEEVLAQHPGVQENVVTICEEQPGDKRLVAYVVPAEKSTTSSEIRSFLKSKLPHYMVPSAFMLLKAMPLTPNGKIDRRALPKPENSSRNLVDFLEPRTSTERIVANLWAEVLRVKQPGIHDNFFELGGHSLLVIQIIARLREMFKVDLPVRYLLEEPTIAKLAEAIDATVETGATSLITTDPIEDLQAETVLDPLIQPPVVTKDIQVSQTGSIFLTGATGFLGAYLLFELLSQTQADIYCLVRCSSLEEGKERLKGKLMAYCLWEEIFNTRIIPVMGNMSTELLGLSTEEFRQLAGKIDLIYHNGAWVNFIYPYSVLKPVNVLGTQEVLRLACEIKVKPVHLISTISIFPPTSHTRKEVVWESDTLDTSQGLEGGYAQTKWVAEKLVFEAQKRGLPVTIYRPARIIGHSHTGYSNTDDFFCRMIKGCIQLGMVPTFEGILDNSVPVDYVSRAIAYLSLHKHSSGKVFHLINPNPVPYHDLYQLIRNLGYALEEVSYEKWRTQLLRQQGSSSSNALQPFLPIFPEGGLKQARMPSFDCYNTLNQLTGTGILCPPTDEALLRTYFSYFIESGFLDKVVA